MRTDTLRHYRPHPCATRGLDFSPSPQASSSHSERSPASNLTEEEISELRMAFQLFDSDNSGSIDPSELKDALTSLGFDSKNASVL